MRCKEWYGWHFPELAKIVQDNIAYCKIIKKIGMYFILSFKVLHPSFSLLYPKFKNLIEE